MVNEVIDMPVVEKTTGLPILRYTSAEDLERKAGLWMSDPAKQLLQRISVAYTPDSNLPRLVLMRDLFPGYQPKNRRELFQALPWLRQRKLNPWIGVGLATRYALLGWDDYNVMNVIIIHDDIYEEAPQENFLITTVPTQRGDVHISLETMEEESLIRPHSGILLAP